MPYDVVLLKIFAASQVLVTAAGLELGLSYIPYSYLVHKIMSDYDRMLQPSGAGNYIQTLLWSMEFVIQVILEQDTIEV